MSQIVLNNLGKSYGNVSIIKGISLSIHEGEFIVLVGPSGCGKSTLLRMIAGLEDITSGELLMHGEVFNTLPAKKRDIAMVFQSYALYPHMKVRDNMSFALKLASVSKAERMARVEEAAEILGLTHLLDRLPRDLSRRPFCLMNRSPTWTPNCAIKCAAKFVRSTSGWGAPPSTSRTIRRRR